MKTRIEIIQDDNDHTNYLVLIIELLNKRFTSQESMEQRWQLNCLDVAQELGGTIETIDTNTTRFRFTN